MGKKRLFFIKNFISIFSGQCPQCATMSPMCNTFLGSLGVAHWVHPVYYNRVFLLLYGVFRFSTMKKSDLAS